MYAYFLVAVLLVLLVWTMLQLKESFDEAAPEAPAATPDAPVEVQKSKSGRVLTHGDKVWWGRKMGWKGYKKWKGWKGKKATTPAPAPTTESGQDAGTESQNAVATGTDASNSKSGAAKAAEATTSGVKTGINATGDFVSNLF